jgi:hypothetical protein
MLSVQAIHVRQEHEFNELQLNVTSSFRVFEIRVVGIFGPKGEEK